MPGAIFDLTVTGPPPGDATVGTEHWIDFGAIPTGLKLWFGSVTYASPGKSITFEIRANTTGQSAGTTGATTLISAVSMTPKAGTKTTDLYKNGRLHTVSIVGSGTEHWWLRLKSKSGTQAEYLYTIKYTTE